MALLRDVKVTVKCEREVVITCAGDEPVIQQNAESAAEFLLCSLRVLSVSGRNLGYYRNPAYKHAQEALYTVIAQTWPGVNEYKVVHEAMINPETTIKSIAERHAQEARYQAAAGMIRYPQQRKG